MPEINLKWFCFLFVIVLSHKAIGKENLKNQIQLENVFSIFSKCQVNLHNYDGVPFVLTTDTPLLIHTKVPSRMESDKSIESNLRLECIAVFHMVTKDNGERRQKFFDLRKPERKWYQLKWPLMDTKTRYDILVTINKNTIASWMAAYLDLIRKEYSTHGLILNIKSTDFSTGMIVLENGVHIVKKFCAFDRTPKFMALQVNLQQFLQHNGIKDLDKAIENVNAVYRNPNIPWSLRTIWDIPTWRNDKDFDLFETTERKQNSNASLMRDLIRDGKFTTRNMLNGPLNPKGIEDEGLDNYIFAFTVLGAQVNVTEFGEGLGLYLKGPAISFNVYGARIVLNSDPKRLAFLSCSSKTMRTHVYDRFFDVAFGVISIFDRRIWLAILVTYAIIPMVLGFLFHKMLKKQMKKEGWLLWHPFTWGIRSLIRQAGDRILNSQRFGWTIFLVAPLLLMSVVISHAFLGHNLVILSGRGYWYNRNPLRLLYNSGVKLVTDYFEAVGKGDEISTVSRQNNSMMSYNDIARMVQKDTNIAYISLEERVTAISNLINGGYYGKPGMCRAWMPVKTGVIWYSWYTSFPEDLNQAAGYLERGRFGWNLRTWVDNRILERINLMKGESQIVSRWKSLVRWQVNKIGRQHKYGNLVLRISMSSNIVYLFRWMLANLGVALLVWGFEWIVWEVHTKPNRKRKKLLEEHNKEVKENEDKCVKIENSKSEKELHDDLVNEALDLVEETRNKSAGNEKEKAAKDLQKREDKLVEELNEDEEHLVNIIEQREDCSDMSDVDRMDEVEIEADVLNDDMESLVGWEEDGEVLAEYGKDGEDSNIDEELDTLEVGSGFNSDAGEEDNDANDGLNLGSAEQNLRNAGRSLVGNAKDKTEDERTENGKD